MALTLYPALKYLQIYFPRPGAGFPGGGGFPVPPGAARAGFPGGGGFPIPPGADLPCQVGNFAGVGARVGAGRWNLATPPGLFHRVQPDRGFLTPLPLNNCILSTTYKAVCFGVDAWR